MLFKNIIFASFILNFISNIKVFDSSLLKVEYFKENKNLIYINSFSNSKGDLY